MKRTAAAVLLTISTTLALAPPVALAAVGTRAPEFALPSAPGGPTRGRFRLADHIGRRPVVVVFWATFCEPCTVELVYYQQLYQRYRGQLMVVGVATDGPDSIAQVGATARQLGITFPIVSDLETQVLQMYNPAVQVPFSAWINRNGVIVRERSSFSLSERAVIERQIARLVAGQSVQ